MCRSTHSRPLLLYRQPCFRFLFSWVHKKSHILVRDLIFHNFTGEEENVILFSLDFLGVDNLWYFSESIFQSLFFRVYFSSVIIRPRLFASYYSPSIIRPLLFVNYYSPAIGNPYAFAFRVYWLFILVLISFYDFSGLVIFCDYSEIIFKTLNECFRTHCF